MSQEQPEKTKRQRRPKPGDVLAIPLGDGTYGFGQVCIEKDYAFFDLRSGTIPPVQDIVSHAIIFRVPVAQDIAKEGKWIIVDNLALSGTCAEYAAYRNQPVGSNQLYIYKAGELTPATFEEVKDLEVLGWWFDQQIVQRLKDHFAGRPNREREFARRIRAYDPKTGQEIKKG